MKTNLDQDHPNFNQPCQNYCFGPMVVNSNPHPNQLHRVQHLTNGHQISAGYLPSQPPPELHHMYPQHPHAQHPHLQFVNHSIIPTLGPHQNCPPTLYPPHLELPPASCYFPIQQVQNHVQHPQLQFVNHPIVPTSGPYQSCPQALYPPRFELPPASHYFQVQPVQNGFPQDYRSYTFQFQTQPCPISSLQLIQAANAHRGLPNYVPVMMDVAQIQQTGRLHPHPNSMNQDQRPFVSRQPPRRPSVQFSMKSLKSAHEARFKLIESLDVAKHRKLKHFGAHCSKEFFYKSFADAVLRTGPITAPNQLTVFDFAKVDAIKRIDFFQQMEWFVLILKEHYTISHHENFMEYFQFIFDEYLAGKADALDAVHFETIQSHIISVINFRCNIPEAIAVLIKFVAPHIAESEHHVLFSKFREFLLNNTDPSAGLSSQRVNRILVVMEAFLIHMPTVLKDPHVVLLPPTTDLASVHSLMALIHISPLYQSFLISDGSKTITECVELIYKHSDDSAISVFSIDFFMAFDWIFRRLHYLAVDNLSSNSWLERYFNIIDTFNDHFNTEVVFYHLNFNFLHLLEVQLNSILIETVDCAHFIAEAVKGASIKDNIRKVCCFLLHKKSTFAEFEAIAPALVANGVSNDYIIVFKLILLAIDSMQIESEDFEIWNPSSAFLEFFEENSDKLHKDFPKSFLLEAGRMFLAKSVQLPYSSSLFYHGFESTTWQELLDFVNFFFLNHKLKISSNDPLVTNTYRESRVII